jgi:hypothetical protein
MDLIEARDWAYLRDPPSDIDPTKRLLERYSFIPPNQTDHHIRVIVSLNFQRASSSPVNSFVSVMLLGASRDIHTSVAGSSSDYWTLMIPATSRPSLG